MLLITIFSLIYNSSICPLLDLVGVGLIVDITTEEESADLCAVRVLSKIPIVESISMGLIEATGGRLSLGSSIIHIIYPRSFVDSLLKKVSISALSPLLASARHWSFISSQLPSADYNSVLTSN